MKILWLSKLADGLDMAYRCQQEGAKVKVCILDPEEKHLYDGILNSKVDNWQKELSWCDFVVFDVNSMEKEKKIVFDKGVPAFGMGHSRKSKEAWKISETLESDRKMVHDLMNALNMGEKHETLEFTTIEEAITHLKKHQVPHVIKPESKMLVESSLTLIGEFDNNEDTIAYLDSFKLRPEANKISGFAMEERLPGIEVAVSAWCNGKDFVYPVNINFEHKRFATGDIGFETGETGTLMYYSDWKIPLFQETLYKMGNILMDYDYRGQIDVNCIVNENGIYPLELTPRFGYPAMFIEQELHKIPWSEFLGNLAYGYSTPLDVYPAWAIGVVCLGEGFPSDKEGKKRMMYIPIIGVEESNEEHVHLCEAMKIDGKLVCSGMYPLVATAKGKTITDSQKAVYDDVIPQIYFPKQFYRTDIGDRVQRDYNTLKKWGIL